MRKTLRKIGRVFVVLTQKDAEFFKRSALIVDNGYGSYRHLGSTINHVKERIYQGKVCVLTFEHRRVFLKRNFPEIEIICPDKKIRIKRYQLAIQMYKLRKNDYDSIILMSLDITPIISALLFVKGRLVLYNRWEQWWSIRFRKPWEFLLTIPKFIFHCLICIYLIIAVSFILLKRVYYILRIKS